MASPKANADTDAAANGDVSLFGLYLRFRVPRHIQRSSGLIWLITPVAGSSQLLATALSPLPSTRNKSQMAVEIKVGYNGQLRCEATHGPSGEQLSTDAPTDNGGKGESFSPTDLVATALGTCVMTILGLVAERHDVDLKGTNIVVTKEMVADPIRRIGSLRTLVMIPSETVKDEELRTRLEAAARKCPVHQSLHADIDAPIEFRYLD
jgi:putative redox protein